MYKRVLGALCVLIACFLIVPVVYLLSNRSKEEPPPTIKGPFIAIYLRNSSSPTQLLLTDTPNSDYALDPSILSDWDLNDLVPSPNKVNQTHQKSIVLECHANVPVKWEYKGQGGLVSSMSHWNKREAKSLDDINNFWFETGLEFLELNEQVTGLYSCSPVDLPSVHKDFYVYGKGSRTFVSKEETRVEVAPNEDILVTCPISDPLRANSIILRELVRPLDSEVYKTVDPSMILSFDPKSGFKLPPNSWGTYLCVDPELNETSSIVKVFKPLNLVVRGDFLTKHLTSDPIPAGTNALRILCESTEEITLNFINFEKFKRRQVYFVNETDEFKFTSRIILRNEWFTNYSSVECVTLKDQRVLRVWKYQREENSDKTTFKFDHLSSSYECCSNSNSLPRLTQATCYTQTECEMKRSCVKLERKCPYKDILSQPIYEGKSGCALAKVEKDPSGILECSYGNFSKTYLYFYNKESGFHNFTSSDFRKKKVPVQTLMRIVQRVNPTNPIVFDCFGPKFFFASGFLWAFKGPKGQLEFLQGRSKVESDSVAEVHESLELTFSETERLERLRQNVTCYAPLLSSQTWANATVKYKRIGD